MSMDTMFREDTRMSVCKQLSEFAQISPEAGEEEDAYSERLAIAVNRRLNGLSQSENDEVWDSWSKDLHKWLNTTIKAIKAKREDPETTLRLPPLPGWLHMTGEEQKIPADPEVPSRVTLDDIEEDNAALATQLQTPAAKERAHSLRNRRQVGRPSVEHKPPLAKKAVKAKPKQKIARVKPKVQPTNFVLPQAFTQSAPPVFLPGLSGEEISFVKALYKALGSLMVGPEVVVTQPSKVAHRAPKKAKPMAGTNGRASWGDDAIIKILIPLDESQLHEGSSADLTFKTLVLHSGHKWFKAAQSGADRRQAWLLAKRGYVSIK